MNIFETSTKCKKRISFCFAAEPYLNAERTWSKSLVFRNYFFLWISTLESPNQKTKLDGMFIFWCWFFDFFSFWPIKSADLQNPGFQSKIWTRWHVRNTLSKLKVWFCDIFTQLLSKCMNFEPLYTPEKWCFFDQHGSHVNTKRISVVSYNQFVNIFHIGNSGLHIFP